MNWKSQTGVSNKSASSMLAVAKILYVAVALFCWTTGFGQENFSFNIKSRPIKNNILSVLVKDSSHFKKRYGQKLSYITPNKTKSHFYVSLRDTMLLSTLREDSNILFIDVKRTPHVEGNYDLADPAINKFNMVRKFFPDVRGKNQTVSIKEESFIRSDIDLAGRSFTTSISPSTTSQHATLMAVLIGGAGNSSPLTLGAANQAKLTASDFNNLMPDDNSIFTDNDICVQNHSYGVGIENYYGIEAVSYDYQVYDLPELVHVFSSGNSGNTKPAFGTYANLMAANLTGTFKQSKNTLGVTAIDTSLSVHLLNSRGPAYDGRIKPELTAFGPGGTSEAAALTSSAVVLIQEKYQSLYNALPNASLVKAILIASADDIGANGVDHVTGYGNLNAFQALTIVGNHQLGEVTLNSQGSFIYPITIPSGTRQIRVAISWTDAPAMINANKALVNDIDSWLDDGAFQYYPWVLSAYPNLDSLQKIAKRRPDHLNNTEFITVDNPIAGTYNLNLSCGDLQAGQQKVSIAYHVNTDPEFRWTYPVGADIMTGGEGKTLSWSHYGNAIGNLYFRLNNGAWQLIKAVDLDKKFKWTPPVVFARAQLKMELNGQDYLSDEFILSSPITIKTEFVCSDSARLSWNKIPNAVHYNIYSMGGQYLQQTESTTDTAIVLRNTASVYFAVLPVFAFGSGLRSSTIDYTAQGALCYLNLFDVQRTSATNVKIDLTLGSLYQIEEVRLIRERNNVQQTLTSLLPSNVKIVYNDGALQTGRLIYRAEIKLRNGVIITSQQVEIIVERKGEAVVWPNPVTDNDYLKVISDGQGEFRLINYTGQIMFTKKITLLEDEMDLAGLLPGLYFYQIINRSNLTSTGRLIKR